MNNTITQNFIREIDLKKFLVFSLSISSLILAFPLLYFPIIRITKLAKFEQANIIEIIIRLFDSTPVVALITLFSIVIAPLLMALCSIIFTLFDEAVNEHSFYYKAYFFSKQWMMLDIFTIAVFASMIKLGELVDVAIGLGTFFCFSFWLLVFFTDKSLWFQERKKTKKKSNLNAFCYALAALFLLIPANILPIMTTAKPGMVEKTNLWESIMHLFEGPAWPIGIIVFLASFCGPWFKIASLFYLSLTAKSKKNMNFKRNLYHFFESVGRWSMIDIFIAVILVSIVKLNALANISLEKGSLIFTAMVILTLLSSASIDLKEPATNEPV